MVTVTILIVEDESRIRAVLTEILEDEGYPVASARNGLEALTYLRQQADRPHLILLDLGMPVMTGWEFRAEQQRDPTLAGIPVIVMSALPDLDQKAGRRPTNDGTNHAIHNVCNTLAIGCLSS
jgi:CheY-like chemotaxis protein